VSARLSGSELVRLAAVGRVDVVRGRIVVLDGAPTGDALLDEALASMTGGRRQPTAKAWVARQRLDAATSAATRAATDAAVAASIDAATQAAVSAATEAAHHAGGHDGGGGGGHH